MQVRYNRSVLTCENRFALMLPDVDDLAHAEMKRGQHKRASQKDFASSLKPRDTEVAGGRVDLRPKSVDLTVQADPVAPEGARRLMESR